jgi:hypothetical protein
MLKALVIVPNDKTRELGDLLAVSRAEARKREHADKNPPVRALMFIPELGVYVAVYEATAVQLPRSMDTDAKMPRMRVA